MVSTIVKPSDYNLDSLTFAPIASNKKKSLQTILLPNYDGGRSPMTQLPAIDSDMYGIPSKCDFLHGGLPEDVFEITPQPEHPRNQ